MQRLMATMHEQYPDDREKSLYASVELSLRRLSPDVRKQIQYLGVFHSGANLAVLGMMLKARPEVVGEIAGELLNTGLAEEVGRGHLRLDPALPPYLLARMSDVEREEARKRWAEGMIALIRFLYEEQFKNAEFTAQATLLELPNLLALLDWGRGELSTEERVDLAGSVEQLLAQLGRPKALAQATSLREEAANALTSWGHAQFNSARLNTERKLDGGLAVDSLQAARTLLARCQAAGEEAYETAKYDTAMGHNLVGQALSACGSANDALISFHEAETRFEKLAEEGNDAAGTMASVATKNIGDCLRNLGRLDEAAAVYEGAIALVSKKGATRDVAVIKGQIGTVRMLQGRLREALDAYQEARTIFESLPEPRGVATAWHQIGMVLRDMSSFEEGKRAYRKSLAMSVRLNDRMGEASTLNELGNLYRYTRRLEEAVTLFQQAVDKFNEVNNVFKEGTTRHNLASALVDLRRYDDARDQILRAVECKKSLGHAAEIWKTWVVLHRLEKAAGNTDAATEARQRAIRAFTEYRRASGENQNPGAKLCAMVAQAIEKKDTTEAEEVLAQHFGKDAVPWAQAMVPKLQAILNGERDPALTDDPDVDYDDVVELQRLLEHLNKRK